MKIIILFITFFMANITYAIKEIKMAIPNDVYKDFLLFMNGRDISKINEYSGAHSRRDVIEAVLVQKIFNKLKNKYKLIYKPDISYQRMIKNVEDGIIDGTATSIWNSDIKNNLIFKSYPVVRTGEFQVGIYTKETNKTVIKSKNDILKLKIVSNPQWTNDWRSIKKIPFSGVLKAYSWDSIVSMLNLNRANITLAPLPKNKNFKISHLGINLVPIKNYKFKIDAQHFIFSKKTKLSKNFFIEFQKELKGLIDSGEVRNAYIQSGFMNPILDEWSAIN